MIYLMSLRKLFPILVMNPFIYVSMEVFSVLVSVLLNDSGIEHVGGDMFVNVPKADAIFMKVSSFWQQVLLNCISDICFS